MAVSRLLGGRSSGHDASHHQAKKSQAAEHNQRKVEQRTDGPCKASPCPPSQDNKVELSARSVGIVDDVADQSVKPASQGVECLSPDEMPESISNAFQKGVEAKSANEARKAIGEYLREIMNSYSEDFPPAQSVSEKLYLDALTLSAKVMSFEFPAEKVSDRKKMIGLTAELLLQMQSALERSSAELVNGQVTAVLSVGLMIPDDRDFLFGTCLNTQVISVDKYNVDIGNLDSRLAELNSKLAEAEAEAEAEQVEKLEERISNATVERANLVSERDKLVEKENSGMHSQKDFFHSCYGIMMDQVKSEIRIGLKELLDKKTGTGPNAGSKLVQQVMAKVKPVLKSKAKVIAKNTANQKNGVKKEDVYKEKKMGLLQLLNEEMTVVLEDRKKLLEGPEKLVLDEPVSVMDVHNETNTSNDVDLESIQISIKDVDLPDGTEVEEWANLLLNKLPVEERKKVDKADLIRCLGEKALEMDIRDGLILPEGTESPFVRNSALRQAKRWKKETSKISVTDLLKKAIGKNQDVQEIGQGSSVQMLIRFFTELIEKEKNEVRKGLSGPSSTWL
ncbi:hypothetical protein [Endozoicomonas elysicola]|uniref:Uncharacterized protein n=1 Tax=Endozoicomonas elysicola TaxID=305900 RepID=A0A081K6F7_9GAMM|nr:hypothetical protein [Endozoicomonas elysicola]KEI69733.1 hypothetical protein GV64_02335 [Endozoicomonas elysicola]